MTYAEQYVEAREQGAKTTCSRLLEGTENNSDDTFFYYVFPDGSVFEGNGYETYTAQNIIDTAPDCLYDKSGENELQRWLLDTVCDITGKPRVTARVVSA
jgi:hypothetical protein